MRWLARLFRRPCRWCHGAGFLPCYLCDGSGRDCLLCANGHAPCDCVPPTTTR